MNADHYKSLRDEEIVGIIINEGKKDLFQILYERYHRKVHDKCFSLLKNKELTNDSVQIIFEKAYEKLISFKGNSTFSSWLYSISYNYCIDLLRVKNKLHYPNYNSSNEIPEIIDETEEDLTEINYKRLLTILDLIHPEEKALLLMKYNDEVPIHEIGNSLRISESAAKMRIKRARARVVFLYKKIYSEAD
ncbi:MAG: RNA polymerase sigma factor [Bacteroidetes bacterium]|nr:RNA polymerase sigma factor [Bacteroidota bacterium]